MNLLKTTTALLAVALVLGTAGCGNSSSDAAITSRVKAAISKEPALKETKVSVSTEQKVVRLSGTVKTRDERAFLIAVARKVEGVEGVKTDLTVTQQQNVGPKPPQKAAAKPQQKTAAKKQQVAKAKPGAKPKPKRELQAQNRLKPGPVQTPAYER